MAHTVKIRKVADCSIRDTDGEFLLIEAANDLPAWVSPENADNRVSISTFGREVELTGSSGSKTVTFI